MAGMGRLMGLHGQRAKPDAAGAPAPGGTARRTPPRALAALALVWLLAALFTGARLDRGWVPHDEGALAQSAERVLRGEIPHRDFQELYTGGLSFLHAAAFGVFGIELPALRRLLFVAFLAWIPAVFFLASRFTGPLLAGAITALAAAWCIPVYSASLPSWYNLFLAMFGAAAAIRYLETGRLRWLAAAGAAGGISVLIKISGLYYVAGMVLFLVYVEQRSAGPAARPPDRRVPVYSLFLALGLLVLVAGLFAFVGERLSPTAVIDFVLPGTAVAALLLVRERNVTPRPFAERARRLARLLTPFVLGFIGPVLLFLAFYAAHGALDDLVEGVLITPRRRILHAATSDVPPLALPLALIPALIVATGRRLSRPAGRVLAVATAVAGVVLLARGDDPGTYRAVWASMRGLVPALSLLAVFGVARGSRRRGTADSSRVARPEWDEEATLLVSLAAFCALVQFPFSAPVYFFYAAPLALLAAVAVAAGPGRTLPAVAGVLVVFHLAFAVRWIDTGFIYGLGVRYERSAHSERLDLPRGGLRVPALDRRDYLTLVRLVGDINPGPYLLATPDVPEVNFLTATGNPTPVLFEFLDDPAGRTGRTLAALDRHGVRAVVINRAPQFSGPLEGDLADSLSVRYPRVADLGRFLVRWRE